MSYASAFTQQFFKLLGATPSRVPNIEIGSVAYGSLGTSAVHVAGTLYRSEIELKVGKSITGIGILNGATAATDLMIYALYDTNGNPLAWSSLAGTLAAGVNSFQELALTAVFNAKPGRYFLVVQCNGTTTTTRRIAANTYLRYTSSGVGAFGTLSTFTPPTTTAADVGPIGYVF